jgi:catechol 2,3-dioxygenase-like lactoylglutathione lyase family enzyme
VLKYDGSSGDRANLNTMASTFETSSTADAPLLTGLVPMAHVENLERSIAFYRLLGFDVGNFVPPSGPMQWAWLYVPKAADWKRGPNLMVTRSDCALDSREHTVLFYLYATDLTAVRTMLLAHGVAAGEIAHPDYLPNGEFQVTDPDGYTLMIAQAAADTP